MRTGVNIDLVLAQDERDLVRNATLIIHGTPVGEIEINEATGRILASYHQDLQVKQVLKGQATADVIRVSSLGLSPTARARNNLVVVEEEFLTGPLQPCDFVLFLAPSAVPDLFHVVGLSQGTLILDEKGRVVPVSAKEEEEHVRFKGFEGLTVPELQERINGFLAQP